MSPRQVAAANHLVWHVKIIVAATEVCHCDLSHEFKLVWIPATYRSTKMSTSSLAAACVRICNKSPRQNLNWPMREHQLVSRHVKFELVYISSLPESIACTEQVSYCSDLSQQQCRRGDLFKSPRCVVAICQIVCLGLKWPCNINSQAFSRKLKSNLVRNRRACVFVFLSNAKRVF